MKKLFSILLIMVLLLTFVGCKKEEEQNNNNNNSNQTPEKDLTKYIRVICRASLDYEGCTISSSYENYYKKTDLYVDSSNNEVTYVCIDVDKFNQRLEAVEKEAKNYTPDLVDIKFNYVVDKKNRTIKTNIIVDNIKTVDENREENKIKNFIKERESTIYKCEIEGTTREALGL